MSRFQDVSQRLRDLLELRMTEANMPGMAVAITDREATRLLSTHGFADLAARLPITSDTLFEIGSIGKSFTTIALLKQHEAGRLDLQAPVQDYLPWFHVPSASAPITMHHLAGFL